MRIGKLAFVLLLLLAVGPVRVRAQTDARNTYPQNVVSANPFLLLAAWFNAEYERRASDETTIGLRLSTLNLDVEDGADSDASANYYSARVFWRFYPSGAPKGFYFGVDAGITGLEDDAGENHTVGGAGFEIGYNWLLGRRNNFYISMGVGADRLFGADLGNVSAVIPTVRVLNIGWAF